MISKRIVFITTNW